MTSPRASGRAGLLLASALSCSADTITLGRAVPNPIFGDPGRSVAQLNEDGMADEEAPTLTQDLLEIFFTSRRSGGPGQRDVYVARRGTREQPFQPPSLVEGVSSPGDEVSPAISRDGLTLWFGSDRAGRGDLDIWRAQRPSREAPWDLLTNVEELNSTSDDIPRPPALDERVMPLASRRDDPNYQTYLAERPSRDAAFGPSVPLRQLWRPDSEMAGAFLTEDGLLLFFHRDGEEPAELYYAWRTSLDQPFQEPLLLDTVNGPDNERDPWINSEGTRFFFATDRLNGVDGLVRGLDVFATTLDLPRFE